MRCHNFELTKPAELFLRIITVSGAGVIRFRDTPMCLRVSDDIDKNLDFNEQSVLKS